MFRASETEPQMSLFDNPSDMMCKRASKKYEDPKAWQNQFYRMVTSEIDESLFQPLFKEVRMGAPNASIRRYNGSVNSDSSHKQKTSTFAS